MDFFEFWTICSTNGIVLDKLQMDKLERYVKELLFWNSKVNLISRKDESNILEHHILHSLSILKYFEFENNKFCLDVGTGGGLPGIPLAIACPNTNFVLVDSIAKKIKITSMLACHTGLKKIKVICSRVEDLAKNELYQKKFDYVVSRAVGSIKSIIQKTIKIVQPTAKYILYKGGELREEINEARQSFSNFNFEEIHINFIGYDYFKKENKKIILAQKD